ncbi:MAG: hypothetical protein K2K70_12025 [Lachnospiraceae bacterium]|nr:hypothetical protein [Lachnospiraceae bacterium]
MAIINCPECNKEISDTVKNCPGCGYRLKKKKNSKFFKTRNQKKVFIIIMTLFIVALLGVGGFFGYRYYWVPLNQYKEAMALVKENKFDKAIIKLEKLNDFKGSRQKVLEVQYKKAESLLESGSYNAAVLGFKAAGNYKDASDRINETKYLWAQNTDIDEAITILEELGSYKDAEEKLASLKKQKDAEEALLKIEKAYAICTSDRTKLASDKKSISVDSSNQYDVSSLLDISGIISSLGLPDSLYDEMCATNALMGRQSESYEYYDISWSFHPQNGLDVVFKYKG